jgi:hypothetical protein
MTIEAVAHETPGLRTAFAEAPQPGWFSRHRSAIIRHAVINFFMVIIILPLIWV